MKKYLLPIFLIGFWGCEEVSEPGIIIDGYTNQMSFNSNDSIEAIKSKLTDDVTIHVIGVGSTGGSLIPVSKNENKAFLKDSSGELVMTKLDEKFLINISEIGKGNFLRVSANESISDPIINIINTGEESLISSYEFSDYDYKYQYPLFFAIIFLFVSYILPTGNRRIWKYFW